MVSASGVRKEAEENANARITVVYPGALAKRYNPDAQPHLSGQAEKIKVTFEI